MKTNRFLCWCLGAGVAISLGAAVASAQTTGAATVGGTSGTSGTGGVGGTGTGGLGSGGGGGGGGGGGNQNSNNPNPSTQATAFRSITSSGGGGGGGGGAGGTSTAIPSSSNAFATTYVDPLSLGMFSKWTQFGVQTKPSATFGKGLYVNATNATGNKGGGAQGAATQKGSGFTTYGTPRTPAYSTVMDPELLPALMTAPRIQADLRDAIQRSSYLSNTKNIDIVVNGTTVELRGIVATEKERRAVENIVGTSPGVYDVVNQLQVLSN